MMCHYWKWDKALPKALCEQLLYEVSDASFEPGLINSGDEYVSNESVRNNTKVFLPLNHWLEGVLYNHARYANEVAGWRLDASISFCVQIARYLKGQKYDWHTDDPVISDKNPIRKISVVAQLNDPKSYQGGGLRLEGFDETFMQNQGDIIVFPSVLKHKAEEVLEGTRYSAALWIAGPPYK